MTSNASNAALATDLASMTGRATFMSVIMRLVGAEYLAPGEKRGGLKIRQGDALVRDTFVTGVSYTAFKARELATLDGITEADLDVFVAEGLQGYDGRGASANLVALTRTDYVDALAEMKESATLSRDGLNSATHDHVFEPLMVDGKRVRGGRVYVGNPNGPDAATPGTVYLHGLRVGRTVVEQPTHGWRTSRTGVKAAAKARIGRLLPRYVSYRLQEGGEWVLNVGAGAAVASDAAGVTVDTHAVDHIRACLAS